TRTHPNARAGAVPGETERSRGSRHTSDVRLDGATQRFPPPSRIAHQPEADIVETAVRVERTPRAVAAPAAAGGDAALAIAAAIGAPFRDRARAARSRHQRRLRGGGESVTLAVGVGKPLRVGARVLPRHADHRIV